MKLSFPDRNVWLALAYSGHQHHFAAAKWFSGLGRGEACFCRTTQVGFLRLLTHASVMGEDVRTLRQAWAAYDLLVSDQRVSFLSEPDPEGLETIFRRLTSSRHPHPEQWSDVYLAAFAYASGLILVTFDRALWKSDSKQCLLLQ
jgi:uncharacterized protein